MKINCKLFGFLLFILLIGVCAGSFYEISMSGSGKLTLGEALAKFAQGEDGRANTIPALSFFAKYALSFAKTYLPFLAAAWLSAWFFPLAAAIPLHLLAKGFSVGFSSALMIEGSGFGGILLMVKTSFIPQTLQLAAVMFLYALSLTFASASCKNALCAAFLRKASPRESSRTKRTPPFRMKSYTAIYCIGSVLIFISCILEAFLLRLAL